MKKTIIASFLIMCSLIGVCQAEDENFYLTEDGIAWRKAFETDKSKEAIFNSYQNAKIFSKIELIDGKLVGTLKPQNVDEKKTGVAGVPPIVNKPDFIAKIQIEYRPKEKDYVVSMLNIELVGTGEIIKKKEKQAFEDHFLKKGLLEYRPYFLKRPKKVYNTTFTEIFDL